MRRPLSTLFPGASAVVREVKSKGDSRLRRRLLELGFLPGTSVTVRGRAPFGDPMLFFLRGYELTLRASDAKEILVEGKEA